MKKSITLLLLVAVLFIGGTTVDAKTTKKKAKARTTQTSKNTGGLVKKIIGHTYENKEYEIQWTFYNNGIGETILTDSNESMIFRWEYVGKNNILIYGDDKIDAGIEIISDGNKLSVLDFTDGSEFIMKKIK